MDDNIKTELSPSEALRQILRITNDLKHQPYDRNFNRRRFDNSIKRTLMDIIKGDTYDSSKS